MTPTLRDIEEIVSLRFGLAVGEMRGRSRGRTVCRPRQIVMFLARELTNNTFPQIGRYFDRDHTTVLMGARRISSLMDGDPAFRDTVEGCREMLARRGSWKAKVRREMLQAVE